VDDYVAKYEIRPHVRFNSEVRSRTWDEDNHLWRLDVGGEEVTARFVISAIGGVSSIRSRPGSTGSMTSRAR